MAATAARIAAGGGPGEGRGDDDVEELIQQLEELNVKPLLRPQAVPVNIPAGTKLVFFDLETTGFGPHSHITQMAAIKGQEEFSRFVVPKMPITTEAQQLTGITCRGGRMYHHGNPVESVSIMEALDLLVDFLNNDPVVVLAHNCKQFDCPILFNAARTCGKISELRDAILGFIDTLPLFRQINRKLSSHSLARLYEHYVGQNYPKHDARGDARALRDVVGRANISLTTMSRHSFPLTYIEQVQRYSTEKKKHAGSWKALVEGKVVSQYIANKAAGNGVSFASVRQAFILDGEVGARRVLQSPGADGKARVTNRKNILQSICLYLQD